MAPPPCAPPPSPSSSIHLPASEPKQAHRFLPLPQGPPSPSFLKPNFSGKTRPSSSLLPTLHTTSPPGSPTLNRSTRSMVCSPTKRELVVLLGATILAILALQAHFDLSLPTVDFEVDNLARTGHGWKEQIFGHSTVDDLWLDETAIRETKVIQHAPGWTVFENLYQLNETFYVVAANATTLPPVSGMISTGADIWNTKESIASREPTDKDMQIITIDQARELFSTQSAITSLPVHPLRQGGSTWITNDPPQFIDHFYHFAAELIYGFWRTYSSLSPSSITPHGQVESTSYIGARNLGHGDHKSKMSLPRRLIFTKTGSSKWRDYSGMNSLLMCAVFPRTKLEFAEDFQMDRVNSRRPYVYDQVVLADRAASMRGKEFVKTERTASEAFLLPYAPFWFSPIRRSLLNYIGGVEKVHLTPGRQSTRPVVTYVSRQAWGRRMLVKEDHEALVATLIAASKEEGWEFVVADMDQMSNEEQIRLASRTTIMMGVHGNGLSHLLWMNPIPQATVLEFFFPTGWAYDYEFTARGIGIQHYGFWNDRAFTSPDTPQSSYPEGFQGDQIPISAQAVLNIVKMRLNNDEEADDG